MSNTKKLPCLKVGDTVKITGWSGECSNIASVALRVTKVVTPELILVQFVKVWVGEATQKAEGRVSMNQITAYEPISVEQFKMLWSVT